MITAFSFYLMLLPLITQLYVMLCVYLQTFEAALFWKKKKSEIVYTFDSKCMPITSFLAGPVITIQMVIFK